MRKTVCTLVLATVGTLFPVVLAGQELGTISALVSAKNHAELSAPRTGVIALIMNEVGASVREGDVLVEFSCDLEEAQVAASEVEIRAARRELNLQSELARRGAGGVAQVERARGELNQAQAQLGIATVEVEGCVIKAPFDGVVAESPIRPFETVSIGTPLITVIDPESVELNLVLPASWIRQVSAGTQFKFRSDTNDKIYTAQVTRLAPFVDPASQTIDVKADFGTTSGLPRAGSAGIADFSG